MTPKIRLEPWSHNDYPLLVRLNSPEMTSHLGGPETEEKLRDRQSRYEAAISSEDTYCFNITLEPEGIAVGNVNFWDREWKGEKVYEMGWGVIPEFQGQGIATEAVKQAVDLARSTDRRPAIHAYPSVDNPPSNGVCRKAGFTLLEEVDFEFPKGHWMRCNDWCLLLIPAAA